MLLSVASRRVIAGLNDAADRWKISALPLAPADGPTPGRYTKPAVYVPDFKLGLQHFCIHAGAFSCSCSCTVLELTPCDTRGFLAVASRLG